MRSSDRIMLFVVILFSCLFSLNCRSVKHLQNVLESVKSSRTKKLHDPLVEPRQPRQTQDESDNNNNYDDGYVIEDMPLMQNDQPAYKRKSSQRNFGQMQNESPDPAPKRRMGSMPGNLQFTKEILIKQGRLRGYVRQMHPETGLKNVRQYLGIPYAAAPTGNGRFMPPGAPPPWTGLKTAIELSPVCPQNLPSLNSSQHHLTTGRYNQLKRLMKYLQNESEDCLFLNLHVPEWSGIGPRPIYPVLVFIHGESFEWNSGNAYDGSILSSYGQVIVVTINYRLGILGFFKPGTTGNTASNFGLLDQIAALQWVKDNIARFGGDVGSVTLMGHGNGAACVNLLMLSPVAQGLFHRAILMSGSAMSDWAISNHPLQVTMQVLTNLDCPMRDDNEEMLTCLRKKRYQDIMKVQVSVPEFSTAFGPVVDNSIVPNDPQKMMQSFHGGFNRYDLLFGLAEIESYNNVNAVGIMHGLLENERDQYLRFYIQNRYEIRPDIAMDATLREYSNIYTNPKRPSPEEHRDFVLEVLSDTRVAAPLFQTGIYHSRVNPSTYMYLFSHISKAGDYPNLMQSITGEDLPYVFGAPLASARPFSTSFTPVERLLSEEIMVYWTNFVKTGNPKAPGRDHFINMDPSNWEQYDIDWPPFSSNNPSYLNIGIPPVVSKSYRQQYMNFWNINLEEQLIGDPKSIEATTEHSQPIGNVTTFVKPMVPHVNYYLDRSTENPIRKLQYLLQQTGPNRSDMYQTQSTQETPKIYDAVSASPENTFVLGDNKIIVKADSTLNVLIAMIIIFLVINVIIITIYLVRRNYFKKTMKRKLDVLSLDGTTDDDLKRSNKYNDGDESFILDIVRRKNEYVPVKRYHSPINGFLLTRHYSTSTMDTHTKVSDWITQEVNRQNPHLRSKSPSFSFGTSNAYFGNKRPEKDIYTLERSVGMNGTRPPIELMKSKSFELNTRTGMVCQESDNDLFNRNDQQHEQSPKTNTKTNANTTANNNKREINLNPMEITYTPAQAVDEQITSFIEDLDVNVTSRDECDGASHFPLTPEETLQIIQMRNYPKVLPKYPNVSSEYVSSSSFKRRSMPSYQHLFNKIYSPMAPVPPPRTTSTLDRKQSMRRSDSNQSEPLPILTPVMAQPIPSSASSLIDEEPEITYNALYVGPLLPGSKENLYSTVNRKKKLTIGSQPCIIEAQIENSSETLCTSDSNENKNNEQNAVYASTPTQPKSIMKRTNIFQGMESELRPMPQIETATEQTPQTSQVLLSTQASTSNIPISNRISDNNTSNSSNSKNSNCSDSDDTNNKTNCNRSIDNKSIDDESVIELKRSPASIASIETLSSAETIKQIL